MSLFASSDNFYEVRPDLPRPKPPGNNMARLPATLVALVALVFLSQCTWTLGADLAKVAPQFFYQLEWTQQYQNLFPKSLAQTVVHLPGDPVSASPVAVLSKYGCLVVLNSTRCDYVNVREIFITPWTLEPVLVILRDVTNDVVLLNAFTGYPMGLYKLPPNAEWDTIATRPCAGADYFTAVVTHLDTSTSSFKKYQKMYLFTFRVDWPASEVALQTVDAMGLARARSVACLPRSILAVAPRNRAYFESNFYTDSTTLYWANISSIRDAGTAFRETAVSTTKTEWARIWRPVFWKSKIEDVVARIHAKTPLASICTSVDVTASVDDTKATYFAVLTDKGAIFTWNTTDLENVKEGLDYAKILPTPALLQSEENDSTLKIYVKNIGLYMAPLQCTDAGLTALNIGLDMVTVWYWNGTSYSVDPEHVDLAVLPSLIENYVQRTKDYIRKSGYGLISMPDVMRETFQQELPGRVSTGNLIASDIITIVAVVLLFLVFIVAMLMYTSRLQ
tara:strand:+ start:4553 stop:6070 length:1518 start_codon:yes stop_codon:yes gene_type:complete